MREDFPSECGRRCLAPRWHRLKRFSSDPASIAGSVCVRGLPSGLASIFRLRACPYSGCLRASPGCGLSIIVRNPLCLGPAKIIASKQTAFKIFTPKSRVSLKQLLKRGTGKEICDVRYVQRKEEVLQLCRSALIS